MGQAEALDELLSGEHRADERNSRRVVIWAALGAAAMAASFTLFLVRSRANPDVAVTGAKVEPNETPTLSVEPVAPAAVDTAVAEPSASALPAPPAAPLAASKLAAPRLARRPKRTVLPVKESDAEMPPPSALPSASASSASPAMSVTPATAPSPPTSAANDATAPPALSTPSAP